VYAQIVASRGVRSADIVLGDWDVLVSVHGADVPAIALDVIRNIHSIDGVARTLTAPIVPPDALGLAGSGLFEVPVQRSDEACFVRIRTEPGSTKRIFQQLAGMDEVGGVAIVGAEENIVVEIPYAWDRAARLVVDEIQRIDGVLSTNTLVAVPPLPVDDRDQFSAWS
jgi:hypothetical protein